MLCDTHELIAERLFKLTNSILNVPLDYENLLIGSVAPDKKPSMVIIPHTKTHSSYLLNKNLALLTSKNLSCSNETKRLLSYNLGIVVHLISDYFCSAHNHIKYLNPIPHFIYENRLRYFFRKNIDAMKINIKDSLLEINNNLYGYIDKKHMEYLNTEHSMLSDFNFTLTTVSSVFIYIVYNLINTSCSIDLTEINAAAC
jgi:hypothetical protein